MYKLYAGSLNISSHKSCFLMPGNDTLAQMISCRADANHWLSGCMRMNVCVNYWPRELILFIWDLFGNNWQVVNFGILFSMGNIISMATCLTWNRLWLYITGCQQKVSVFFLMCPCVIPFLVWIQNQQDPFCKEKTGRQKREVWEEGCKESCQADTPRSGEPI